MKKKVGIVMGLVALSGMLAVSCSSNSFSEDKAITVVTREDGSGTKSAFMEIIGLKGKADVEGAIVATSTAAVMQEVSGNQYAIAFDSLGYVTSDVNKMTVNGAEATVANIKSGTYAIARPLNVIYKEAAVTASALDSSYLSFLGSKEAQSIVSDNGYVAIHDDAVAYSAKGTLSGKIEISGSTSLQPLMIKLASKFETLESNVTVEVSGGGSGTGYSNGESGVSAFGMISETFNSSKAASCTSFTVAKDGIAVIANKKNPHLNISLANLKNIYDSTVTGDEKISSWGKVS